MSEAIFAIPGDVSAATGGYAYDRRIMLECAKMGFHLTHCALPGSFPFPDAAALRETRQALASLPSTTPILIDGLAFGAFDAATLSAIHAPLIALVHHPLAYESGLTAARKTSLLTSETAALAAAHSVIAVSQSTAQLLVETYGVPYGKIAIANPGVDVAARARGSHSDEVHLLAVGAISPRKAYPLLIEALAGLASKRWRLTIAGPIIDETEAQNLALMIASTGLSHQIDLAGKVTADRLAKLYDQADIFVMSSLFEGYGMVITEALSHGLPIVSTTGGALAETVPDAAALKVAPGNILELRNAVSTLLDDRALRQYKADGAWQIAGNLPRWSSSAAIIMTALKEAVR